MQENTRWETARVQSGELVAKVRRLVHEGNIWRMVIKHDGRAVFELPVTVGVIAVVVAPVLAVAGAIAVATGQATVDVERVYVAAATSNEL
jgi:hypothetical protein